jgi:hypothetical protein
MCASTLAPHYSRKNLLLHCRTVVLFFLPLCSVSTAVMQTTRGSSGRASIVHTGRKASGYFRFTGAPSRIGSWLLLTFRPARSSSSTVSQIKHSGSMMSMYVFNHLAPLPIMICLSQQIHALVTRMRSIAISQGQEMIRPLGCWEAWTLCVRVFLLLVIAFHQSALSRTRFFKPIHMIVECGF